LRKLVDAIAESDAAGAGGGQRNVLASGRPAPGLDAFFRAASIVAEYARHGDAQREVEHIASCNAVYRRDVLLGVNGFREGLFPGEDVDLDYRLRGRGHRLVYVPGVDVEHLRPGTTEWFARWMRSYGASQRELVRLHGRFRPIQYLPPLVVAGALLQLLWLSPVLWPVVAVADTSAIVAVAALVISSGPPREWIPVLRYAVRAAIEWHRGYFFGRRSNGGRNASTT
jgi:GT2 family glycosyltransferase